MDEKLKLLLKHWIEHNKDHTAKYKEWAEKLRDEKPEISKLLCEAVEKFKEGEKLLEKAYEHLGME